MDKITISIPESDTDLAEMQGDDAHRLELFLDFEKRSIEVEVRLASDNSWTAREHHGHAMTVGIVPQSRADARDLLAELVVPFAKLCAQYSSRWDGSNHVAQWADPKRAEELRYQIERLAEDHTVSDAPRGSLWDAPEWLEAEPPVVAADATDEALEAAASEIQAAAHEDGIHLCGLDEYLERLRDEAAE
jgi:hypothetical protein